MHPKGAHEAINLHAHRLVRSLLHPG